MSAIRTESSTNRGCRWACSTTKSSSGRFRSSNTGALIERSTRSTSVSASISLVVPTSSVPRPRWLWVAMGTSSRICSIASASKPASVSRSAARPATSPCAHGQALIPVASTPTTRLAVLAVAAAIPIRETISCVGRPVTGVTRRIGQRAVIRTSARMGVLPLDDVPGDHLGDLLDDPGFAEDGITDRLVEDLREARHVDALLAAREVDRALDVGGHHRLGIAAADPNRLLHAGDAGAGERELDGRRRRLHVVDEMRPVGHPGRLAPTIPLTDRRARACA